MPETVKIHANTGIVEIVAEGDVTIEHMEDSRRVIAKVCSAEIMRGLLYDVRKASQTPDPGDLFDFAKQTVQTGHYQGMRFALLKEQSSSYPELFLTIPASNHGQQVMVFTEHPKAMAWLEGNDR